jgi:hypothetical protein
MSLDVYLNRKRRISYDDGETYTEDTECVFSSNITHNLNKMAMEAGIYQALWRPEEIGKSKAGEIFPLIEKGLADLKERPGHYKKFNSDNGWGTYHDFVAFVEEYLEACKMYPHADIEVSR